MKYLSMYLSLMGISHKKFPRIYVDKISHKLNAVDFKTLHQIFFKGWIEKYMKMTYFSP